MLEAVQNDGSISGAANAIAAAREASPPVEAEAPPAAPQETERAPSNRAPDGKFQKSEPAKEADAQKEPADTGEDDEDYLELELPGEGGAEPKRERHKVSEVFAGFQRSKELEAELAKAKEASPLPTEYESAVEETITERTKYIEALQSWATYNQPREPDVQLLNPASPNYNPELYYQQKVALDETRANQAKVKDEIDRVSKLNEEQQSKLLKSRLIREHQKLEKIWPELKDKAVAQKVATDLEKLYGVDGETLKSVTDSRFYALAKDALAFRAAQTAQKEAVKAVVGKPKLVRANARTQTNGKAAAFQGAMGKLASSHSVEDAAAAIAALNR
jgi:hypothetical protein